MATNPPSPLTRLERRLRLAGTLIVIGLALQAATLLKVHPLAFIVFLGLGTPVVAAGIVIYLLSLIGPANGGTAEAPGHRTPPV